MLSWMIHAGYEGIAIIAEKNTQPAKRITSYVF